MADEIIRLHECLIAVRNGRLPERLRAAYRPFPASSPRPHFHRTLALTGRLCNRLNILTDAVLQAENNEVEPDRAHRSTLNHPSGSAPSRLAGSKAAFRGRVVAEEAAAPNIFSDLFQRAVPGLVHDGALGRAAFRGSGSQPRSQRVPRASIGVEPGGTSQPLDDFRQLVITNPFPRDFPAPAADPGEEIAVRDICSPEPVFKRPDGAGFGM